VALAGVEGSVDLTSAKQNATTDTTRDVVRRLHHQPVRLTGFAAPLSRDSVQLEALAKQFRAAGARINLTIIDPDVQPGTAREAGISGYGEALVELGERKEVLRDLTQGALTSTLVRLSRPTKARVCFTAGHGERDIADQTEVGATELAGAVRFLYDVKVIALAAPGARAELERCAVVVVAGPRFPFLPEELALLVTYARDNGRLLVLADATEGAPRRQLNELLAPWGVSFGSGIVRDASALAGDPSSVVSLDYGSGSSPPVRRLVQQEVPVVMTNAVPIEHSAAADQEGAFSALVRSSPKSWIPDDSGRSARSQGPFVLAGLADWGRIEETEREPHVARTRIGVVGSAELITNRMLALLGNREFATALVQWIAYEDDLIAAGRPPVGFDKLVLTSAQRNRMVRQGIVVPGVACVVPLPLVVLRMRRG
jgi:hypothetical protein